MGMEDSYIEKTNAPKPFFPLMQYHHNQRTYKKNTLRAAQAQTTIQTHIQGCFSTDSTQPAHTDGPESTQTWRVKIKQCKDLTASGRLRRLASSWQPGRRIQRRLGATAGSQSASGRVAAKGNSVRLEQSMSEPLSSLLGPTSRQSDRGSHRA